MTPFNKTTRCSKILPLLALAIFGCAVTSARPQPLRAAQSDSGSIEFVARVTPTGARPEPVRQFTFYLLKKSYAEIRAEAEQALPKPDQESFISQRGVSDELKAWMKKNHTIDLTSPEIVNLLTADAILSVPEFREAFFKANKGLAHGLPTPRFKEAEKTQNPEKYANQKADYEAALQKFIVANPLTLEGTETELAAVTPHLVWARLMNNYRRQIERRVPELAQTKYLVAKTDTDLEGRGLLSGIPQGKYWLGTLGTEASSGDARLNWDVEVSVQPGRSSRLELTNLNAAESRSFALSGQNGNKPE